MRQCDELPQIGGPCDIASRHYKKTPSRSNDSDFNIKIKIVFGVNPATGEEGFYRVFPDKKGNFPEK